MDPNVAWDGMCKALLDRDMARAKEYAEGLRDWLRKGGFSPRYINGEHALDIVRAVIKGGRDA